MLLVVRSFHGPQGHRQPSPDRLPDARPARRARARASQGVAGGEGLRADPAQERRAREVRLPRRSAVRQRLDPPGALPEQDLERHRGEARLDEREALRLRPGLGLPRPAYRAASGQAARGEEAAHERERIPPRLPQVRRGAGRGAAPRVPAPRRPGPLGRPLLDDAVQLRGGDSPPARRHRPQGRALPAQAARALVRARPDGAGGGGGRVQREDQPFHLRRLPRAGRHPALQDGPGAQGPSARAGHLDHHALDAAGEHGHRGEPRDRVRRLRPGRPRGGGGEGPPGAIPRRLRPAGAGARADEGCAKSARALLRRRPRGRDLPPSADRAGRQGGPGRACHHRDGNRPGAHRARARRGRLPDGREVRAAHLGPGRRARALHGGRRHGPFRQERLRGEPGDRRQAARGGRAAQRRREGLRDPP